MAKRIFHAWNHRTTSSAVDEETNLQENSNRLFVWLDQCESDYKRFQEKFCQTIPVNPRQWFFFQETHQCRQFLQKAISSSREIILITSGRLGAELITHLHHHEEIHSIYIYCQNVPKYRQFAQSYEKILSVSSNPLELFNKLIENLEKKTVDKQKISRQQIAIRETNLNRILQPSIPWNPWEKNSPTATLPDGDPLIISITGTSSIPFKIILSDTDQLKEIYRREQYSIHIDVQRTAVTIGSYNTGRVTLHDSSQALEHVLPTDDSQREYHYWIGYFKSKSTVLLGIGEIRLGFQILEAKLNNRDQELARQISHVHICIDKVWQNFHEIDHLKEKIRFELGTYPLIDHELLIHPKSKNAEDDDSHVFHPSLSLEYLPESLQSIYEPINNFKWIDAGFSQLISSIEHSFRGTDGWCYQKLMEKSKLFGHHYQNINSIRISDGKSIVEILPPGYSTPIRHHQYASGIIRVLHGSILMRLFPSFTKNCSIQSPMEYLLHKDQVTWMLPRLNQTHQMKNVELNSLAIVLQHYQYRDQEKRHGSFDYLHPENRTIQSMTMAIDISLEEFKQKMRHEWMQRKL